MNKRLSDKRRASIERAARKAAAMQRINGNCVIVAYPKSITSGQQYLRRIGVPYSKTIAELHR
jgi:hypothetical protein